MIRRLLPIAAAACALVPGAAVAAPLPADTTAILSGTATLDAALPAPASPSAATAKSVSQDGRFAAFSSSSDGLLDGDDDTVENVYVKDRASGAVILASRRDGAGEPSHARCSAPAMSDDGTRVAFTCEGQLDPADSNSVTDVYVRDLPAARTYLVSRASGLGAAGDSASDSPALSQDGRFVAFTSRAGNFEQLLLGEERVYRREIGNGDATVLVSRGASPTAGRQPAIDDAGGRIAFVVPDFAHPDGADTNASDDVYVRDVAAGTLTLVSRADGNGAVGNGDSGAPAISGNGDVVAWDTAATNFVPEDTEPGRDVYRRSLTAKTTALASVAFDGSKGENSSTPSIDDGGWLVAFVSAGTSLDPADQLPARDAYLKDMEHGGLQLLSRRPGADGAAANARSPYVALSGDGKHAAITVGRGVTADADPHLGGVIMRDLAATPATTESIARPAGDAPFTSPGGAAGRAALSADGRYAAFASEAPGLGLPDDVDSGVFVRDRVTGAVVLASRADGPASAPITGTFQDVDISADGKRVAFSVGPSATPTAVWVRELATGRTWLASRADGVDGAPATGGSGDPALDGDGSRVAFLSSGPGLAGGDADTKQDIFVRDLDTGRTFLASVAGGAKDDNGSYGPDLSADGTRVAFVSGATNFPGANGTSQAYVRDLAGGTTRHVSTTAAGPDSLPGANQVSIDAAGTRVAYTAPNGKSLAPGGDVSAVLVADLATGAVTLASRADGAAGAQTDGDAYEGRISPDGGFVAFASAAGNLGAGGVLQVFRRDLAAGRTALVSRRTGAAGAPVTSAALPGGVSAGGRCVSFTAEDATRFTQAYLRAFTADCAPPPGGGAGGGGGGGDGGAGPGGDPSADTAAPAITRLRMTRRRFAPRRSGTAFVFRLSEDARTAIAIRRCRAGRCKPAAKLARAGTHRGRNRVAFSGRIGGHALRPGRYRATVTATDAAGNTSAPHSIRFRIVRT
jgi:Tol biopolymer transport system component